VNLHLENDLFGLHLNIIALSLFLFINFGYTTYFFVVVFNIGTQIDDIISFCLQVRDLKTKALGNKAVN